MFKKSEIQQVEQRVKEPKRFIQVLLGPRQIGKTTLVKQLLSNLNMLSYFVAADAVPSSDFNWIEQQWETLRYRMSAEGSTEALLVIDEIQKIDNWAEMVKAQWDRDTFKDTQIKVILLGSARLLLQQGLTESLAGRYEVIQMTHWTYSEMHEAFGITMDKFVWFGGYPGTASLMEDEDRWKDYILNSLVETTISKDILMLTRIDKPAILRRLFELGCAYSGQILSLTKMLGQLQDAGNTTTLSHYLELLDSAGLLTGLEKYTPDQSRKRASIPKWQVQNTAFSTALGNYDFDEARSRPEIWGRYVENAVGMHLQRAAWLGHVKLYYWREGNDEIDFVVERRGKAIGLEVKSGKRQTAKGIAKFKEKTKVEKVLLIGNSGIQWEDFLKNDVLTLF